jgi:hypothetical protein
LLQTYLVIADLKTWLTEQRDKERTRANTMHELGLDESVSNYASACFEQTLSKLDSLEMHYE